MKILLFFQMNRILLSSVGKIGFLSGLTAAVPEVLGHD